MLIVTCQIWKITNSEFYIAIFKRASPEKKKNIEKLIFSLHFINYHSPGKITLFVSVDIRKEQQQQSRFVFHWWIYNKMGSILNNNTLSILR